MDITNIGSSVQFSTPMVRPQNSEPAFSQVEPNGSASNADSLIPATPKTDDSSQGDNLSKTLTDSLDSMNKLIKSLSNSLQFSLDEDTGKTVVKLIDSTTQEVIKQFPSEEALALTKALDNLTTGLLVQQKA